MTDSPANQPQRAHVPTAADLAALESFVTLPTRGDTPLHDAIAAEHGIPLRHSNVA